MNTSKTDIRISGDYQRKVSNFVSREILMNINELMQAMLKSESFNQGEYSEELMNICSIEDYIEPMTYEIENATDDSLNTLQEFIEWANQDDIKSSSELIKYLSPNLALEFCRYFEIEPYQRESLEFWVVSEYLGRQLSDHGENVQEILDMTIWGRTCSGQSISMDGVICDIYDDSNED